MSKIRLALIILLGAISFTARPQSNSVPPTVTVAMGDVGGKLYGQPFDPARTRHYYIAAEPQLWDFAPDGRDVVCGKPFTEPVKAHRASMKMRYVEYTDATFSRRVPENPSLGILGPVLRGLVGEQIAVTFWNRANIPLSMHPHGVEYDKDNEGSYYQPDPGLGAAVAPGAKFTYVWALDASSGPLPTEPSSKAWLYHSHVSGDDEINLGLIGFIIVTDPKRARPDGTPADVDRELASLFLIFDETGLTADQEEAAEHAAQTKTNGISAAQAWAEAQEQKEAGERYAINGRIFGNLHGLEMNAGERVHWYLFALGSETDFHTPHWHGLRVIESGHRTDTVELMPASMKVADMVADNPGSWLFHCHVAEHMMEGMFARVIVNPKTGPSARRAAGPAFFGLPAVVQSLRVTRAEASIDFAADASQPCEIKIEGEVEIPEAFKIAGSVVQIQLGGKLLAFRLDRNGSAEISSGRFHALNGSKNSSEYGVVYGGSLKFTLELSGVGWRDALAKAGLKAPSPEVRELAMPMSFQVGGVEHQATIQIGAASH